MDRLYPRPQFKRKQWQNLTGQWDFDYDDCNIGKKQQWNISHNYTKTINVPFPYQSKLSMIHDTSIHDQMWYHKTFTLDNKTNKKHILHFGAVDYECEIYLNGKSIGTHIGGSSSFSFDITSHINDTSVQELTVFVYDPSLDSYISRGKQTWRNEPFECFYHRSSGIWQTVWIESINEEALKHIAITPDIDNNSVRLQLEKYNSSIALVSIEIKYDNNIIKSVQTNIQKKICMTIPLGDNISLWSPESPNLYDVIIQVYQQDELVDEVESYFGMRKISIEGNQVYLNNKPYYLRLILDQGYYKDGLVSYPTDYDLIKDIELSKEMGFNGCRKHEKVEDPRFLYYADKMGFLVSLEMPSQYSFKANNPFVNEWLEIIKRDYSHPSIFMYVPFNESWGVRNIKNQKDIQDYATAFYYITKSLDPSRIVSSNDGWEQTKTDVCAIHTYKHGAIHDVPTQNKFEESMINKELLLSSIHTLGEKEIYVGDFSYQNEPIILSEFGGVSFANQKQNGWGYTGVNNQQDFTNELSRIFKVVYKSTHFSGFCYTQLTDVEQEINGLLDYNRNPKIDIKTIRKIVTNT